MSYNLDERRPTMKITNKMHSID